MLDIDVLFIGFLVGLHLALKSQLSFPLVTNNILKVHICLHHIGFSSSDLADVVVSQIGNELGNVYNYIFLYTQKGCT